MTMTADRFNLRALRASDAGLLGMYLGDVRVADMTRQIPNPLPPDYVTNMITRANAPDRSEDFWAIDGSAQGHAEVMGLLKLNRLDRNQSEIRYWVAPAFWNSGIASEAVACVLAANPQGACDIYAEVFQDNPTSARVLTNAGFAYLGDAETFSVARGAVIPTWTYVRKMGTA
nr:GNAT family protein [Pseudooctadecabacter jejudonensis]